MRSYRFIIKSMKNRRNILALLYSWLGVRDSRFVLPAGISKYIRTLSIYDLQHLFPFYSPVIINQSRVCFSGSARPISYSKGEFVLGVISRFVILRKKGEQIDNYRYGYVIVVIRASRSAGKPYNNKSRSVLGIREARSLKYTFSLRAHSRGAA